MVNRWVEFVRNWSAKHGVSYMCAVSMPEMRNEYHRSKTAPLSREQISSTAASMTAKNDRMREAIRLRDEARRTAVLPVRVAPRAAPVNPFKRKTPVKTGVINPVSVPIMVRPAPAPAPKKGRPFKYTTDEERKAKKREQTLASNKRKNLERKLEKK